jgi:hypothetical protein
VAARSASDRTHKQNSAKDTVSLPSSAEDPRWNAERQAVEFGVKIGEYRGVVRVSERPTPERCVEAYYLQRTPVRAHRRAKAAPAPVDLGRECGDQRAGFATGADMRLVLPLCASSIQHPALEGVYPRERVFRSFIRIPARHRRYALP